MRQSGTTVVVFCHPRCPCTPVTLRALAQELHTREGVSLTAVLYTPARDAREWMRTDLEDLARSIKGADVFFDVEGVEASRFGALTSGDVFVYGADGALKMRGGLTPARGHEGVCNGLVDLERALDGVDVSSRMHPVFGCPIFDSDDLCGATGCQTEN